MAAQGVLQFITIVLSPPLRQVLAAEPVAASVPPASLADVCAKLKAVPGVASIHAGHHHENPARWTVFARWASPDALAAFVASAEHTAWAAALKALTNIADGPAPLVVDVPIRGDTARVLAAPCVECFTAHGVDPAEDWLGARLAPFAAAVTDGNVPGNHGIAYGVFEQPADSGFDLAGGPAARGLLGWDTVEAHLAARGEGKLIDDNIHHVRGNRKQVDMFHVYLTEM
jgi:quinol monooxygenase YgiN